MYAEEALNKAAILDQKKNDPNSWGQLYGVVIGIKDVLCYKDHYITGASAILKNHKSIYSATAIQR